MAQVRDIDIIRSVTQQGKTDIMIDLAIVFFGGIFALLMLFLKGPEGSVSILMLIIVSASIYKFMGRNTTDIEEWDFEEDLEHYNKYQLQKDQRIIKQAMEGSEVYRNLLEKRLVEEIFYRLENVHDIPKRKIYNFLKNDREKLKELLGDEYLADFVIETKYREEMSGDNFLEENPKREIELTSSEYRKKLYRIMKKIEQLSKG